VADTALLPLAERGFKAGRWCLLTAGGGLSFGGQIVVGQRRHLKLPTDISQTLGR
jgi:hypothetical protein